MPFFKVKTGNVGFIETGDFKHPFYIYIKIAKILFGFVVFSEFSKKKKASHQLVTGCTDSQLNVVSGPNLDLLFAN